MIETERWLTHYYENLRQMHSLLKDIYFASDFLAKNKDVPADFIETIDKIDRLLYEAEKIAMREYGKG